MFHRLGQRRQQQVSPCQPEERAEIVHGSVEPLLPSDAGAPSAVKAVLRFASVTSRSGVVLKTKAPASFMRASQSSGKYAGGDSGNAYTKPAFGAS